MISHAQQRFVYNNDGTSTKYDKIMPGFVKVTKLSEKIKLPVDIKLYDGPLYKSKKKDLALVLEKLKAGKTVEVPIYDFKTHSRLDRTRHVYGANVILFEGIFAFYDPRIRDLMDLKIFVDTDDDIRLARRCNLHSLSPQKFL